MVRNSVFRVAIKEIVDRHGSIFGPKLVDELSKKGIDVSIHKVSSFARYKMHNKDIVIERVLFSSRSNYHNLYKSLGGNAFV